VSQESLEAETPEDGTAGGRWLRRLAIALFLLAVVAAGTAVRGWTTLNDPSIAGQDSRALLKSDPGLLYYVTERIADAGGLPPADFRADPRIEHPGPSDIPAMFSVGQEFVVAWAWLLLGREPPLHLVALWVMAFFASLTVLGVFGLAWELSGRRFAWAAVAALVFLVLQANYRTIGFLLIREDFSLPWLALHLYFLARAVRLGTRAAVFWAAFFFVLAASTWHAMAFVLTIEAMVVLAWSLRTGENPMRHGAAWVFPATVAAGSLVVPVLLAKAFLLGLPMLVVLALWFAAAAERRSASSSPMLRLVAPAALVLLVGLATGLGKLTGFGRSDYSHVLEVMTAKVANLGQLPQDPGSLTFDARLLWQGPFATVDWTYFHGGLGAALAILAVALVWGALGWARGRGDSRLQVLIGVALCAVLAALLVRRMIVLPAMLAPVIGAVSMARLRRPAPRLVLGLLFALYQLPGFWGWISTYRCPWYLPPENGQALAEVVRWIEANVPEDEAICSDYVTGTAVLAHAGNPMLVQPKYETTSSRRRIETFMMEFLAGDLPGFRRLLVEHDCRYVLVSQPFWRDNLYTCGFNAAHGHLPDAKAPCFGFCNPNPQVASTVPGFELVYGPPNLFGGGMMRVYRMTRPR